MFGYDTKGDDEPDMFKSFAPPILSFLRSVDLSGKTIISFCTHGDGGFRQIKVNISKDCPSSMTLPGFESTSDFDDRQVEDWIDGIKILE